MAVSPLDINQNLHSRVARTDDGGNTWTTVSAPANVTPASIAYVPGTGTYIVVSPAGDGEKPGCALTSDNGATWQEIETSTEYNAVAFVSGDAGWAGGITNKSHGGMYKWMGTMPTAVARSPAANMPQQFSLSQNYPNPFNPNTTIEFSLAKSAFVALKIYNIAGEEIAALVSERLAAGKYQYDWDAGTHVSGIYFYKIEADNTSLIRKCLLVK
ncbi:T9SS type A sorting domain-containing protein [candidate division KSB1 bacterium]|nr:T9SS type A sorting domain-containing protein [candidate division KSB1 bacterium]